MSTKTLVSADAALDWLAPTAWGALGVERIGIAVADTHAFRFRVEALRDRDGSDAGRRYEFDRAYTAGDWVCETRCPLFGARAEDMRQYPETHQYLVRERFESNLIVHLDLGRFGSAVLFALSRSPGRFDRHRLSVAMRIRDVVEPALRASFAADEWLHGSAEGPAVRQEPPTHRCINQVSLDDVQREHIEQALQRSNGMIEGPRGAAKLLGINPSTLRNRMRKLGIPRSPA